MNEIQVQILRDFREAIATHEWYHCELRTKELLEQFSPIEALKIGIDQIDSYLPLFEQYHPNITWPRLWLDEAKKLKPIDYTNDQFGFWDEDEIYSMEKTTHGRMANVTQRALRELSWKYDRYFSQQDHAPQSNYHIGIGNAITGFALIPLYTYIDENCREVFEAQLRVSESMEGILNPLEHFSKEELLKMEAISKDYRNCRNLYKDTYWEEIANRIEQRLLEQP